ncbi:hypothetical protein BASA81_000412 [Batrachochytrium salamandrivorans]|nr:hypothetical protein BASA81_000412 [Batrachochytrium salamandrivorans]
MKRAFALACLLVMGYWRLVLRKQAREKKQQLELLKSQQPTPQTLLAIGNFLQTASAVEGYSDPWALRLGGEFRGSVQTIGHYLARALWAKVKVEYTRQLFTLADGGTVGLDWAQTNTNGSNPLVLIHHGLCGSSDSVYVQHLVVRLASEGYDSVVLVARGCGGLKLTTPEGFTAARTGDMREALHHVSQLFPHRRLFAVGFSLGAGLLLKFLGEEGSHSKLAGAVAISPSFNFAVTPKHFNLWSRHRLVHGLVEWAKQHDEMLKPHPDIKWDDMLQAKSIRDFDEACVVGPYSYLDVDHYYSDASPIHVSGQIATPTLTLNALDDPVCCGTTVPGEAHHTRGPGLVSILTARGGHVAFAQPSGGWSLPSESWMDQVVVDWFNSQAATEVTSQVQLT